MMLGDVEPSQPQRGEPVYLFDPVAGHEMPDVTGLDPLAKGGDT